MILITADLTDLMNSLGSLDLDKDHTEKLKRDLNFYATRNPVALQQIRDEINAAIWRNILRRNTRYGQISKIHQTLLSLRKLPEFPNDSLFSKLPRPLRVAMQSFTEIGRTREVLKIGYTYYFL